MDTTRFVVDPFYTGMPYAGYIDEKTLACEYLLLTHAHEDHVMDAPKVLESTHATLVANYEMVNYFRSRHGIEKGIGMNVGGKLLFKSGFIKMVSAVHSSSFSDGTYGGLANGYLIEGSKQAIYFAGDTSLHADMKLLNLATSKPIISVLPLGGLFTMHVEDALHAAQMINSHTVIGCHFDTFPPIKINHQEAIELFESSGIKLVLMSPGENIEI